MNFIGCFTKEPSQTPKLGEMLRILAVDFCSVAKHHRLLRKPQNVASTHFANAQCVPPWLPRGLGGVTLFGLMLLKAAPVRRRAGKPKNVASTHLAKARLAPPWLLLSGDGEVYNFSINTYLLHGYGTNNSPTGQL